MATIISFAILGVLCLLVPTLLYLSGSGPVNIDKFGAFFGSTTGPLLSFLALLAVVMSPIAIEFMDMLLQGEKKRATAQAMSRHTQR
ncbi:hypothetical protein [Xanthomonas phaseoli]|uniref:hypothetical protein n=1 Tax=Xanthomonas phaseoli TaxID=1985254 RepID=UPI000368E363|nr:hypothetical protein [Xanthomonas phaseoli]